MSYYQASALIGCAAAAVLILLFIAAYLRGIRNRLNQVRSQVAKLVERTPFPEKPE